MKWWGAAPLTSGRESRRGKVMTDTNLRYGRLDHITVLHDNPLKAARFVRETMPGRDVDSELCFRISRLGGGDNECERITAGGVVYQFMKPCKALAGSEEFFEKNGPQVYSYCIAVDDVDAAVAAMEKGGAKVVAHPTGDDRLPYNAIYEGEGDPIGYGMVDVIDPCGLRFEFIKKNPQLPCPTGVRYPEDQGVFQHAEIVVPNAVAAADFMCDVMGAERTEKIIYDTITDHNAGTVHVLYGGIVFQLIEPHPNLLGWKEHMDRIGPSTRIICYHFKDDLQPRLDLMTERGAEPIRHPVVEGVDNGGAATEDENCLPLADIGTFGWMYGDDGDAYERPWKFMWVDSIAQCGMNWEMIEQSYRWVSSTGYFFSRN